MYCKYCGSQIADDSVFCARCGKLVVEATTSHDETSVSSQTFETQWMATDNMQWKKPYLVRVIQILAILLTITFSTYCMVNLISEGKIIRYFGQCKTLSSRNSGTMQFVETRQYEEILIIKDSWGIFNTKAKRWNQPKDFTIYGESIPWAFGYDDIQKEITKHRVKIAVLGLLPSLLLLWVLIRWVKKTRFPNESDGIPCDVADEIEEYQWFGFGRYKYIFFKKGGKYGIIDARNYCVIVPAQYDSIKWRMSNKTFDVTLGEEKQTISIEKPNKCSPDSSINELNEDENAGDE